MIQRIQSLYLLLAAIAIGILFFFPFADLLTNQHAVFTFRYRGLYELKDGKELLNHTSYLLAILLSIILVFSLFTIFKYKNRVLQMRLCMVNILLIVGSAAMALYYIAIVFSDLKATLQFHFAAIMPIIAVILCFLAYKGIQKDEKLIKSIDRIR